MSILKRGTRIEYTYAGGKVVQGKIVRHQDMDNVPGRPDLKGLTGWYHVSLVDEHGPHQCSVHESQIEVVQ